MQRRVPKAEDHRRYTDWQFVPDDTLAAADTGYGIPQFAVDFGETTTNLEATPPTYAAPTLWGDNRSGRQLPGPLRQHGRYPG